MGDRVEGRIAFLWRGDPNAAQQPAAANNRLSFLFEAFAKLGLAAEPVVYADEIADAVRERLLGFDGVMVWIDPITQGQDRSRLDPMLREVASRGVWVSAHPDVILKMGTKEVLFRTRKLGWGVETELYSSPADFARRFPDSLASRGPRVLKQRRGNGGIGTFKVELAEPAADAAPNAAVHVIEAHLGGIDEVLPLREFMTRCEIYFAGGGCIVDQPFQPRAGDGMVRCYMVQDKVAGFSTQSPRAGHSDGGAFAMAREKTMYPASEARFQSLCAAMESRWVPEMRETLSIDADSLPVLWDADFLYGPKNARGEDSYVLCEINVSAVFPFPPHASEKIAAAAAARTRSARDRRAAGREQKS